MSAEACCFDGRPFGKLEREFVCVVCARRVCAEHSTDYRINPFTGERGHACRRCLAETVEGNVEAQVASLFRQFQSFGAELKALTAEVQALRQEVSKKPEPPPAPEPAAAASKTARTAKPAKSPKPPPPTKPAKAPARLKKSPAPAA